MPRMPKGMFQRPGRGYYARKRIEGKDRWIALGQDYETACRMLRELNRSGPVVASKAIVREVAREWLEKRISVKRTAESVQKAETRLKLYLDPFLGAKFLGKLERDDLWSYRRWLETHERKLSAGSVWHILSDVRCLLLWCVDTGKLDRSPFPRGLMPKLQEIAPRKLEADEVVAVAGLAEPYGFVVRFALATGLRWGELTRAQAGHVDGNGVLVVEHTKSCRIRRIPLPPSILSEVRLRVGRLVP